MSGSSNILTRLLRLVWHHGYVFFTKSRSLPPIAVWALILYLCFDINFPPLNAVRGYMSIMPWLFFIMVWLGYLFLSGFEIVSEHILILQINSRFLYAVSKILFLLALSMIISLFGCMFPVAIQLLFNIRGLTYMPSGIRFTDFIFALVLSNIIGALGVSLAYLFQPNPSKRRNDFAMSTLVVFAIFAIAKDQILTLQAPYDYALFIFTPMVEIISMFNDKDMFIMGDLILPVIYGGIYCAVSVTAGYWLYNKRLYGPRIVRCR